MKEYMKKISHSIIPVLLLFSMLFLVLLFVQFKASENSDKAQYINITAQTDHNYDEDTADNVIEVDFSDDPRIKEAQNLIDEKKFHKAEAIYFDMLSKEPSVQVYNWLGILYLQQKKYKKAVVSFSNALEINPHYYRARFNRALTYDDLGETNKAIQEYKNVLQTFDSHVKSNFNLGLLLYKKRDYNSASFQFKKTTSLSSGDIRAKSFYFLGKSYSKSSPMNKKEAIEAFKNAIRIKPNHINSRLALIELEHSKTERGYKNQLKTLNALLEADINKIAVYSEISKTYLKLGKNALAVKNLEDAMLQEPNDTDLRFKLIDLLMSLGNDQEAVSQLNTILAIDPFNNKARFLLGLIYYKQKRYESSLQEYKKISDIKSEVSPELLYNTALVYSKMDRYKDAENAYKKAISMVSNYPEALYNLGLLYYKQDKLNKAKECFTKAIALRSNYSQAYYNLALIFTKLNMDKEAIKSYEKLLIISPKSVKVKLNLAVRYSKMQEYQKAQELYTDIVKQDSSYFTAWLNLGLVYYKQNLYKQSIEALSNAVDLEPQSSKAFRILAKSYSALNMHEEAIDILAKLLANNPSDIKTRLAYARAYYSFGNMQLSLNQYDNVIKLDSNNNVAKSMINKIKQRIENASK